MNDYFVLRVKNVPAAREPWLSEQAFDHGALGISEALGFEQPEGEETVHTIESERRALDIYFPAKPDRALLDKILNQCPQAELSVSGEANRDWLAEWKKGFKPFALEGPHWVVPSWCEAPPEATKPIRIDPGMAFGTGTHETTQLMAQMLVGLQSRYGFNTCLDVGTGTGILAILAKQLGFTKIRATEIEPEARRVARENFAANGAPDIEMTEAQVEDIKEKYDVVMANIIDGVLVRMRKHLLARVRPGGWLIVSGIITEREREFLRKFDLLPRSWLKRLKKGEWLLFAARL